MGKTIQWEPAERRVFFMDSFEKDYSYNEHGDLLAVAMRPTNVVYCGVHRQLEVCADIQNCSSEPYPLSLSPPPKQSNSR